MSDTLSPQELRSAHLYPRHIELNLGCDVCALLAHIDTLTAAGPDPQRLGRAMDRVEELDAVHGVVGRGSKAERVVAEYAILNGEPHDA